MLVKTMTIQTNNNVDALNTSVIDSGQFRISELIEDGEDKTAYFSSFTFTFNSNGSLTATSSSQTLTGNYLFFTDDGLIELRISSFPNTLEFEELNDDWYFISETAIVFRFEDAGDVLEFTKL